MMGLKFRRRQKIFPGFYVNFSTSGISTTLGLKGFSVNLNKEGAYLNTGIPGTGIYDRNKIVHWKCPKNIESDKFLDVTEDKWELYLPENLEGDIKSKKASEVTTKGLIDLKKSLIAAHKELESIKREVSRVHGRVKNADALRIVSKIFLIGFVLKWFDRRYLERREYLDELQQQLKHCHVDIEIHLDRVLDEKYFKLKLAFDELSSTHAIWDITNAVDNLDNRSFANTDVKRRLTRIGYEKLPFLNTKYEAMCFVNKNGSNIYIYPGFAALFDSKLNFGLIELEELEINYTDTNFVETEKIPKDSTIVGQTWLKVNKDGSPDRRFKENYRIPIVRYGELTFNSNSGVYEAFLFSNAQSSRQFSETYDNYVG